MSRLISVHVSFQYWDFSCHVVGGRPVPLRDTSRALAGWDSCSPQLNPLISPNSECHQLGVGGPGGCTSYSALTKCREGEVALFFPFRYSGFELGFLTLGFCPAALEL